MGMYTELLLKVRIKEDIPADVYKILAHLFKDTGGPRRFSVDFLGKLIDHPYFKCPRWSYIGNCSSSCLFPYNLNIFENHNLFSLSSLKNYDSEIELFLDWINPYLDHDPDHCIGWIWYEENDAPTLIYKQ